MKTKMMKKSLLSLLLLLVCIVMFAPLTAFAEEQGAQGEGGGSPRFIDQVGLLTDEEAANLTQKLDEISIKYEFDVIVAVIPALLGKEARLAAADLYESKGFGQDGQNSGIILLLATQDRDYGLATTGRGIQIINPSKQDGLKSKFLPYLGNDDYYGGFMAYANGVNDILANPGSESPGGTGINTEYEGEQSKSLVGPIIISLIIALIIALIVTGVWKAQLKSVRPRDFAKEYIRPGSMLVTGQADRFLYRHVTMTERPKDNDSSSGGSSFSSSSGSSWSGSSGKY